MGGLEISLTGVVAVRGEDGVERRIESPQAQVALVRLTLDRTRGTRRDELADTLWPGELPATWESRLRNVISQVRRSLKSALPRGTEPLVARGGEYRLQLLGDVRIDIEIAEHEIRAAQAALEHRDFRAAMDLASAGTERLRKPLLPDREGAWVAAQRERLGELHLAGMETASLAATALGDTTMALAYANEVILLAPLRESAHRCCMAAYAAAGNRAEALRVYEQLRRTLAEELGVDPAPETEVAYIELLAPTVSAREGQPEPSTVPDTNNGNRGLAHYGPSGASQALRHAQLVARQVRKGSGKTDNGAESGDLPSAMDALRQELHQTAGPGNTEARLALALDLATIAHAADDWDNLALALHHRAMAAATLGDGPTTEEALVLLSRLRAGARHPAVTALLAEREVAVAVRSGRFAEAELSTDLSPTSANGFCVPPPGSMARRQLLVARWLQGLPLDRPPLSRLAKGPLSPPEQVLVALAARTYEDARRTLRAILTGGLALPAGDEWLHAIGILALAAVELADATSVAAVRDLLAPYEELHCGVGYRAFVGTAAFHLGRLAAATGDLPRAERHLVTALGQLAALNAEPWLAFAQNTLAAVLEHQAPHPDQAWATTLRRVALRRAHRLGLRRLHRGY